MTGHTIELGVDYDPDIRRCSLALRDIDTREGFTLTLSQQTAAGLTALLYFAAMTDEDWSSSIRLTGNLEIIGHD